MAEDLEPRLLATARRAVAEWDLDIGGIELASRSENVVFKLTAEGGKNYALRLHRPGYNTLEELNSELVWTDALRDAGVDIPGHVLTRDGRGYAAVTLDGTDALHYVGIIEWIEGEPLAGLIETAEGAALAHYFEQIGELAARIHNQAAGWAIPGDFTRRAWDADGLVGDAPLWGRFWEVPELNAGERELLHEAKDAIHGLLLDLGQSAETYSLTHADLHARNLLVDRERVQLIDFDDSGFGWHHYEIAVALYDYRHRDDFTALRDALVRGYRKVRDLNQEAVGLLPVFFLVRSLVILGWLNDRRELGHESWIPAQVKTACREARELLERSWLE